jgi:hypothetical protein
MGTVNSVYNVKHLLENKYHAEALFTQYAQT